MPSTIGPNAKFLNEFFEAKPAEPVASSVIAVADHTADRMQIAKEYLTKKFHKVSQAVEQKKIEFSKENKLQAANAINFVREGDLDIHGYIGMLFNFAAAPFKDLFKDFQSHLGTVDLLTKISAESKPGKETPLPQIIQAGVDSAAHIWEAILKSIVIKRNSQLSSAEFKGAFDKTKDMLLDLTQIPMIVFSELESYLFKRGPGGYHNYGVKEIGKERLGHDIKSDAINYNPTSNESNLDFEFLRSDQDFIDRKGKMKQAFKTSDFDIYGCPALQIIPLFMEYMQQVFNKYLFPHFDEIMEHTKFD